MKVGEGMLDLSVLRRVGIFSELSDEQLDLIFRIVQMKSFTADSLIFSEGERGEAVYFVSSGRVKISTITADGKEKILNFMEGGQVFGEVVLFEGGPYPASALAMTDSEIGILQNPDLFQVLQQHGELAISLLRLFSRRLRMAQSHVRDLALKDAFTRVGELVLRLADESGQYRPSGMYIRLWDTREDLANLAGTSRETFTRMLSEYKQRGLITVVHDGLIIPDVERLRAELSR